MFSDVAGYTAIMGRDEEAAMRALEAHRQALRTLLPQFHGRLIGEIGDGTLSSFRSAMDANIGCGGLGERTPIDKGAASALFCRTTLSDRRCSSVALGRNNGF